MKNFDQTAGYKKKPPPLGKTVFPVSHDCVLLSQDTEFGT